MNCTIYMVSCNFAFHVTCSLTFMTYKYSELQLKIELQGQLQNTPYFHSEKIKVLLNNRV
jgi:hypothetical protein